MHPQTPRRWPPWPLWIRMFTPILGKDCFFLFGGVEYYPAGWYTCLSWLVLTVMPGGCARYGDDAACFRPAIILVARHFFRLRGLDTCGDTITVPFSVTQHCSFLFLGHMSSCRLVLQFLINFGPLSQCSGNSGSPVSTFIRRPSSRQTRPCSACTSIVPAYLSF